MGARNAAEIRPTNSFAVHSNSNRLQAQSGGDLNLYHASHEFSQQSSKIVPSGAPSQTTVQAEDVG